MLAELFRTSFDTGYFNQMLEKVVYDPPQLRDIRNFLYGPSYGLEDSVLMLQGIEALEKFSFFCRRHILPSLRDLLEISGFSSRWRSDKDRHSLQVLKGLFAYAFPHNLKALEEHTLFLRKNCQMLWMKKVNYPPVHPASSTKLPSLQ